MSKGIKLPKASIEPRAIVGINPIAHYKMNDSAATTTVVDSMGNYNGTASFNTEDNSVTGKINEALTFNGASDYVSSSTLEIDVDTNFSGSLWIKPSSAQSGTFLSYRIDDDNGVRGFWNNDGTTSITVKKDGTAYVKSLTSITANQWHHIVFSWDTSTETLTVKIDNTDSNSTSGPWSMGSSGTDFNLGRRVDDDNYFAGSIDDVRIYNIILNDDEFDQLYAGGDGTEAEQISGNHLVGAWGFNNGLGFKDSSGQGNDLTNSGVTLGKNGGFEFDGTDDYIDIDDVCDYIGDNDFAISTWITKGDSTDRRFCAFREDAGAEKFFLLGVDNNNNIYISARNNLGDGNYSGTGSTVLNTDRDYYIMVTYDKANYTFNVFLDGELEITLTLGSENSFDLDLGVIGAYEGDGGGKLLFWLGNIREFQVFDTIPSEAEIKQIYQAGVPSDSENLVLHVVDGTEDLSVYNNEITNTDVIVGDKMKFNGTSSYLTIPDDANLKGFTQQTINVWVNPTAKTGYIPLIFKGTSEYYIWLSEDSNIQWATKGLSNEIYNVSNDSINLNTWQMLTFVYDGSKKYIYRNGDLLGSVNATGTITSDTNDLVIGKFTSYAFSGIMDDVRICPVAKSEAWIKQYYDKTKGGY